METLELYKQIVEKQKELIEHLKRDFYMPDEIYNDELTDIESDLSALNQQLSAREQEEPYTANDVDGAYFLGVFNSKGIDGLSNELKRIKKIGILPSQSITMLKQVNIK